MRSVGGGRKPKLSFDEQVLLVLFWYKLYLPLWLLGLIVSLDSSNISRLIDKYKRLIEEAADPELKEMMANLTEVSELSIDATEQRIRRPSRKQKRYYSSKKRLHTIGTQIAGWCWHCQTHVRVLCMTMSYSRGVRLHRRYRQE
jgi:hypothetical protein